MVSAAIMTLFGCGAKLFCAPDLHLSDVDSAMEQCEPKVKPGPFLMGQPIQLCFQ